MLVFCGVFVVKVVGIMLIYLIIVGVMLDGKLLEVVGVGFSC